MRIPIGNIAMVRLFASALVATLAVTASTSAATRPAAVRKVAVERPVIARLAVRRGNFAFRQIAYRINDVGNPAIGHPGFSDATLVNFNNTGQILGSVREPRGSDSIVACTVYNAGRFSDVPAQTASHVCQPQSMSDADPKTGAFSIVGFGTWPFSEFSVGFVANVSPQATTFRQFVEYPSLFTAVNDTGTVIGYYSDFGNTGLSENPYVYPLSATTTSTSLTLLQESCPAGCFTLVYPGSTTTYLGSSYFHSGLLNDAGLVLGYDARISTLAVFTLGQPASTRDLVGTPSDAVGQINDANQVAYNSAATISPFNPRVFIDTLATGKIVQVPTIEGSSCSSYSMLNFSDTGIVFGVASGCAAPSSYTYFLYDPAGGTRAFVPALSASTPLINFVFYAVNDRGQVLFTAYNTATKMTDWGTLDPLPTPTPLPPPRL